jgi:hypothetical protein
MRLICGFAHAPGFLKRGNHGLTIFSCCRLACRGVMSAASICRVRLDIAPIMDHAREVVLKPSCLVSVRMA